MFFVLMSNKTLLLP